MENKSLKCHRERDCSTRHMKFICRCAVFPCNNYAAQSYNYKVHHPDYLLLDGHTTLLNAGGCLQKNKGANEFWNCVQEWLERKIPSGTKTSTYQLHRASRLLVTHGNRAGQQTEEHATELAVPKDFAIILLADGA